MRRLEHYGTRYFQVVTVTVTLRIRDPTRISLGNVY
jgi:hypothetical protein